MPCPTCDHTMDHLISDKELNIYHCIRCGTIKTECSNHNDANVSIPKLVERTRRLWDALDIDMRDLAWTIGVTESIWKREEQPKGKKSLLEMGAEGRAAGEVAAEKATAAHAAEEELREADPDEHRRQFLAYKILESKKSWRDNAMTAFMREAVELAELTRAKQDKPEPQRLTPELKKMLNDMEPLARKCIALLEANREDIDLDDSTDTDNL